MAKERRLHFLHLTERNANEFNPRLIELQGLLNDGWNILQAIPLAGVGGMATVMVTQGHPGEATQFAEWASLIILEKAP